MLASYSYGSPYCDPYKGANPQYKSQVESNGFGIYLIDAYGNKELIYRDPFLCCVDVAPYKKRNRPAAVPDMVSEDKNYATCVVTNVYEGVHEDVEPGSIQYIRVSQHLPTPYDKNGRALKFAFGAKYWSTLPSVTRWTSVREIGLIPVEEDGSAHFKVPVAENASVYFQALDENYMEVQRMRSSVSFQPGEVRSCTGCHETQNDRAPAQAQVKAIRKPPVWPEKPAWGHAPMDYESMIQPIFDRKCIQCHDGQHQKTNLDLTDTKIAVAKGPEKFNQSYMSLQGPSGLGRDDESLVFLNDRFSDGAVTLPKQFGSHKSKLIQTLLKDHHDVDLTEEEWYALVTWVDYNAPYHGRLVNKYPSDGSFARRVAYDWPDPWGKSTGTPAFSGWSMMPEADLDITLLVSDPANGKIYRLDRAGNIKWEYDAERVTDIHALANGNILVTDGNYVKEVDRAGRVLLKYKHSEKVNSCQQLTNGFFLLSDSNNDCLLLLDRAMKPVKEIPLDPRNKDHRSIEKVRVGPRGTYFLAEGKAQTVGEYNEQGELLRSIPFGKEVHCVVPLNNGNIILGGQGGIHIVDQQDHITWALKPVDIPEANMRTIVDIVWLPNGNLLVVNETEPLLRSGGLTLFEVTPDKEIVQHFKGTEMLNRPVCLALEGINYNRPSGGNYVVANPAQHQIKIYSEKGDVFNQVEAEACTDLQKAEDGNFIYTDGNMVKEMTPEGQIVGLFNHKNRILSCTRLSNGQTVVFSAVDSKLTFFDRDCRKVKDVEMDAGEEDQPWGRVRQTIHGTLLVAGGDATRLKEYDLEGNELRLIHYPHIITALAADFAGNTITGHKDEVRIISPENELIWKLTPEEVPEVNMMDIKSIEVRENGNLLVCSKKEKGKEGTCMFEISREKKVVRQFSGAVGDEALITLGLKID